MSFLKKIKGTFMFSEERVNHPKGRSHAVTPKNGLLISFFIFLPFFVLIAIFALKWNKTKYCAREERVSEG